MYSRSYDYGGSVYSLATTNEESKRGYDIQGEEVDDDDEDEEQRYEIPVKVPIVIFFNFSYLKRVFELFVCISGLTNNDSFALTESL